MNAVFRTRVAAFSRAATSVETSSLTERCTTGAPVRLRLTGCSAPLRLPQAGLWCVRRRPTGGSAPQTGQGKRMMVAIKPPAPPPPAETFAVHDQVTHDKYGLGVILGVEDDVAVLVDFGPQRLRIPVPCAKLTKL